MPKGPSRRPTRTTNLTEQLGNTRQHSPAPRLTPPRSDVWSPNPAHMNVADVDLLTELTTLRNAVDPAAPKPVYAGQALLLARVDSPKAAVQHLLIQLNRAFAAMAVAEFHPQHPLLRAYGMLLAHPDAAEEQPWQGLDDERSAAMQRALEGVQVDWDAEDWEWKLVQFLKVAGGQFPFRAPLGFASHTFGDSVLDYAWNAMIDLAVYRGLGLL